MLWFVDGREVNKPRRWSLLDLCTENHNRRCEITFIIDKLLFEFGQKKKKMDDVKARLSVASFGYTVTSVFSPNL